MIGRLLVILAMVLCVFTPSCQAVHTMKEITKVTYTSDAGTILPELQWHEVFVITRDGVVLTRNGRTPGTQVNTGTWNIAIGADTVDALFARLESIDPDRIHRVEPEDPPDGGGTVGYEIAYGRDRTLSLLYDPGTTYTGGEQITAPVLAFLQDLALPAEAVSRYSVAEP